MGIFSNLTGWHFLIVLLIVLLVFGATRLPALARSLGQSTKILRDELSNGAKGEDGKTDSAADGTVKSETATPAANGTSSTGASDKTS
jgi:sec-independent protein translocase protein TatA